MSLFSKLYQGTMQEACEAIYQTYVTHKSCVMNYVYFANIANKHLLDHHQKIGKKEDFAEALLADYKQMPAEKIAYRYQESLTEADYCLPDGIAMQIYYRVVNRKRLANLNGTDFSVALLDYLEKKTHHTCKILLYGTYPHILPKAAHFLKTQGHNVVYTQDGYDNLDRKKIEELRKQHPHDCFVLIVGRSTPLYPIQELRSYANRELINTHQLLVMTQAGTFDFWAGEQKRAPLLVRKLKGEWLWRVISDPKRNRKKVRDSLQLFGYIFSYFLLKNKDFLIKRQA